MEEQRRMLFDASAYMLFEATGDSESAFSDYDSDPPPSPEAAAAAADEDDDDAQSCSYGSSSRRMHEAVDCGDEFLEFDYCSSDDYEEYDDDDGGSSDEEEDGVVDQCRRRRNAAAEIAKSKGCDESNAMMMNEREGDRLFWEACLAS